MRRSEKLMFNRCSYMGASVLPLFRPGDPQNPQGNSSDLPPKNVKNLENISSDQNIFANKNSLSKTHNPSTNCKLSNVQKIFSIVQSAEKYLSLSALRKHICSVFNTWNHISQLSITRKKTKVEKLTCKRPSGKCDL